MLAVDFFEIWVDPQRTLLPLDPDNVSDLSIHRILGQQTTGTRFRASQADLRVDVER